MLHDRIFRALNDSGCPYVVVGGLAAVLHGVNRLTHDIDLVVELRAEPALQVITALSSLGYRPKVPVDATDFADSDKRSAWIREKGMQVFSLWDPSNELPTLDLFVEYPVDFDELLADAAVIDLGDCKVSIASVPHLIRMKRKAGRDQDMRDIETLSKLTHD
jgi:hypothetical protein